MLLIHRVVHLVSAAKVIIVALIQNDDTPTLVVSFVTPFLMVKICAFQVNFGIPCVPIVFFECIEFTTKTLFFVFPGRNFPVLRKFPKKFNPIQKQKDFSAAAHLFL